MREAAIEAYLRDQVRAQGGRAYKFVSPGNNGVPDRLVLLPGGQAYFVELKATGRKSTKLQMLQQQRIAQLGFDVSVIDSRDAVDDFLARVQIPQR